MQSLLYIVLIVLIACILLSAFFYSSKLRHSENKGARKALRTLEPKSRLLSLSDLDQIYVEDIMVPKADIIGINLSQSWSEILEQLENIQHTRLPLFKENVENLVGMIHVRDILNHLLLNNLDKDMLLKIADDPYFVPEATPLNIQIINFQKRKERSCFVVDEYGDIQGLVTLEDILEEVVGEFTTDISNLGKNIIHQEDNSVIVDASITLRYLKRMLGWELPKIGPRTLSGLVIEYLGYIPYPDTCLRMGNFQIDILKVSDNMVKTVRMWKL